MSTKPRFASVLFIALSFSAHLAHAGGPSNIAGLIGRMENLTCRVAYVMSAADVDKQLTPVLQKHCNVAGVTDEVACRAAVIRKLAKPLLNAVLSVRAIDNQVNFVVTLTEGGVTRLHTIEKGTHADGNMGQSYLNFGRVGLNYDPYAIQTEALSPQLDSVPSVFVPLPGHAGADLDYFFVDRCPMTWVKEAP